MIQAAYAFAFIESGLRGIARGPEYGWATFNIESDGNQFDSASPSTNGATLLFLPPNLIHNISQKSHISLTGLKNLYALTLDLPVMLWREPISCRSRSERALDWDNITVRSSNSEAQLYGFAPCFNYRSLSMKLLHALTIHKP
jgi:hypothetical protein